MNETHQFKKMKKKNLGGALYAHRSLCSQGLNPRAQPKNVLCLRCTEAQDRLRQAQNVAAYMREIGKILSRQISVDDLSFIPDFSCNYFARRTKLKFHFLLDRSTTSIFRIFYICITCTDITPQNCPFTLHARLRDFRDSIQNVFFFIELWPNSDQKFLTLLFFSFLILSCFVYFSIQQALFNETTNFNVLLNSTKIPDQKLSNPFFFSECAKLFYVASFKITL